MRSMKLICFIAFLCAGAWLSVAQITFLEPTTGEAFNDKDPATDCSAGIFTFDGISGAGRTISYSILTVDPSGAGNVFSVNSQQRLVCDPDLVQSTTYTITAQGDDSDAQGTVTFTVSFVATDPLVITLPATTLTLVKDLFETVAAADRATEVNFEFTVSKDGASVTVLPVSPATEVPFEATLKTGTTNTFVLDLTQSLNTSDETFSIDIKASTTGPSAEETTERVTVTLENRPQFTSPFDEVYTKDIDENIASSTPIVELSATDADNDALTFSIASTTPPSNTPLFRIDGTELKREADIGNAFDIDDAGEDLTFNLTISVSDGTYQSETIVIINIQDVNDVTPTFSPGQTFVASVLETTPAGEEIFKATASDLDFSAPNNEIMFSLTGTDYNHFMINDEGSVTVTSPSQLNYTSNQQYELEIVVADKGTPSLSASVSFNVTVETAPKFTTPSDSNSAISQPEDTTSGSSIFKFVGDDEDSEPGNLVYTLESVIPASGQNSFFLNGDTLETNTMFDIDGSGNSVADYTLRVSVSDTKYTATTMLSVNITDVNDERPVFNETSYSVNIPESQNTGEEILKVSATDSDATSPNNEFSYSLSGTSSDHFSIDADTGSISVASPSMLDYTDIPVYNIQVAATDKGATFQFTTAVTLTITIETAPKFTTPSDSNSAKSVAEDTASGSSIFQFVGEDEDSEPEDLEYTLEGVDPVSGLTFFYVDGDTLKTNTTFDLESSGGSVADYTLTVSVTDGKYTATTILSVNITDVNDEAPTFDEASYALDVLESQTAGEVILNVSATDNDLTSPGNEFSFSLTGTASNHFSIDVDTGSISVTSPSMLNFTNIPVYNLQVVATDKGSTNQLTSSVPLTLTIKTAPVFIEPPDTSIVVTTSETTGPNSLLLVTEVMDKDQEPTSLIFSVTSVQPASGTTFFTMDGVTLKTSAGITTSTFDLEPSGSAPVQSYVVDIRVFDGTYSADTTIRVNITDVNDHTPEFSGPITQTINDVLEIDQEVTVVTATDDDYSDEYNTVTYSLEGLDDSQDYTTFQIGSSTGSITLASELKKRVYTFLVKATDSDAREANATVTVSVTDTVDECSDSPCQNAATCYNNINYFYCDCVDGWTGTICNTNINDCDPNPCENNGECIDGIASYSCNCSSGWTGTNCTEACTNNRYGRNCAETCQCNETRLAADVGVQKCNITTGYCFCNAMWTGADCTIDVDECAENTSLCADLPNEVCENTPGSYECVCRQGFVKNATQICVQDVAENTTVSTNTSETVVRTTFTQNLENCPDLTKPSEYDRMQHQIEAAELIRIPSAISLQAFGLSCGSITYELAIVINDTDAARLSLANDLSEVSNGKPLVLENQSTLTTAMNVSGNPVATNRTVDASVLLCNIFTSYSPCGSSYECRISAGIPRCVKRDDDDNIELILGLSLGIPLAVLALACLVLVICFCQRIMRDKELDSGNRPERSRRDNYDDRRRDTPSKSSVPAYEESDQRVPYMPYTPSVEYNYRSSMPILSGTNKANPGIPHKDWIFYSPAKNGAGNYRYSQRY